MKTNLNVLKIALLIMFGIAALFIWKLAVGQEDINVETVPTSKSIKVGWQPWYPYTYLKNENIASSLTGLDIQLINLFAKEIPQKVIYQSMPWASSLEALRAGTLDMVLGAAFSEERAEYVYYSKPYRIEEDSLFVLRRKSSQYTFQNSEAFIRYIKENKFRLGVSREVVYVDSGMEQFIADPKNSFYIVHVEDKLDALKKLTENEIDGFLMDRVAGAALILNSKYGDAIAEHNLNMKAPIYLIFSKKSVPYETVLAFNHAIDNLKKKNVYEKIISWYLYPVILLQTVNETWFEMIEILGTLFFSVSGVLIARSLNASIFAAFIYAVLPSVGGGLLRDIIFNQRPVDVLTTPLYIMIVFSTVIFGFGISKFFDYLKRKAKETSKKYISFHKKLRPHFSLFLVMCDALGLSAFTVSGVMVSIAARAEPLWLWGPFFSFLTGAAGTILRDIICKNRRLADIEGEIYSEVAIGWGLFLSLGLLYNANHINPDLVQNLVFITVVGAFLTRLLIYYFKVPNVYFK